MKKSHRTALRKLVTQALVRGIDEAAKKLPLTPLVIKKPRK